MIPLQPAVSCVPAGPRSCRPGSLTFTGLDSSRTRFPHVFQVSVCVCHGKCASCEGCRRLRQGLGRRQRSGSGRPPQCPTGAERERAGAGLARAGAGLARTAQATCCANDDISLKQRCPRVFACFESEIAETQNQNQTLHQARPGCGGSQPTANPFPLLGALPPQTPAHSKQMARCVYFLMFLR